MMVRCTLDSFGSLSACYAKRPPGGAKLYFVECQANESSVRRTFCSFGSLSACYAKRPPRGEKWHFIEYQAKESSVRRTYRSRVILRSTMGAG